MATLVVHDHYGIVRLHSKEDMCGRAGVKSIIMLPGSILFASAHPDTPIKVGHA